MRPCCCREGPGAGTSVFLFRFKWIPSSFVWVIFLCFESNHSSFRRDIYGCLSFGSFEKAGTPGTSMAGRWRRCNEREGETMRCCSVAVQKPQKLQKVGRNIHFGHPDGPGFAFHSFFWCCFWPYDVPLPAPLSARRLTSLFSLTLRRRGAWAKNGTSWRNPS